MAFSEREILEELARRSQQRSASQSTVLAIRKELFDRQTDFIDDPSRHKLALCTRRAGKTSMWARYCTMTALTRPKGIVRIWAVNRIRAKQLLWDEFRDVFRRHGLTPKMHETELTIRFPNDAEIRLLGADKDKEAQKKRGDKTVMEVVIEAQLFGPYLRTLVEEVAEPCLFDAAAAGAEPGVFCLEGTPGPLCVGYWWESSGREDFEKRWQSPGNEEGVGSGWSCHRWSVLDNPFLPKAKEELLALIKKRRWNDANPTYVREWMGKWVNDNSALYYRFEERRNTFTLAEVQPWGPGWQHVLGWDLGSRDDMALVVWGWHPAYPDIYEAFSWKKPGALAAEVMGQVEGLEKRGFNIIKKVADTGGGGRMYVEEVMSRYSQVFEPAKKTEKFEHARLFNDDLLTGHIKVQRGSEYAVELASLPRDPDWPDPDKPEAPPREDPRFPNHLCDSGLYAWRAAFHYLYTAEEKAPAKGTPEYYDAAEHKFMEELKHGKEREWWEPERDFTDDLL